MIESIHKVNPLYWATAILLAGTVFTFFWLLDSFTHTKLRTIDITDKELQTHRTILIASVLMEMALVGMYWFSIELLPFFIAFFITRTVHEFIDELHWHANRCSSYESFLHLGMWLSVLSKTFLMFMWGFFDHYSGILGLPIIYYIWGGVIIISMGIIGLIEWKQ